MTTTSDKGIGRRITRYSMFLTISGILCKLFLLMYTIFAVDVLGETVFGRIEYLFEIAIIFSVLVDFGLEQTVTRELSRRRNDLSQEIYPLLLYRLSVSIIGTFVLLGLMILIRRPEHSWGLIYASVIYFFIVCNVMIVRSIVRSVEWMGVESWANILDKVAHIGFAMYLLFVYPNPALILLCYSAGALVSLIIYMWVILKEYGWTPRPYKIQDWLGWQKLAVPIGLSAACILLLHREDTVMVNWLQGDKETGLYRAPYRLLEGLFLFPQVLAISAYPVFSKLYHEQKNFSQTAGLLLRGLLLLSLPMATGGIVIANGMISTLIPKLGTQGGIIFAVLVCSLPFIYTNFLLGTILNATNRQNKNLWAAFIGLLSNAILNIPAIYYWGAIGASVMTVVSQGLYGIIMLFALQDKHILQDWLKYLAILAAAIIMAAAIAYIPTAWYWQVIFGMMIYAVLVYLLKAISIEDVKKLKQVIRG